MMIAAVVLIVLACLALMAVGFVMAAYADNARERRIKRLLCRRHNVGTFVTDDGMGRIVTGCSACGVQDER